VTVRIAPSILSANFANLAEDIRKVEGAGADMLHVDVMDGHFVPNITIGPPVVKSIREATKLPLDVHLMISDPDKYIPAFADAGANVLTIHAESTVHLDRTLNLVRSHNVRVGLAVNPATPLSDIDYGIALADMLLIMTVNPGFGGQKFIRYAVDKIRQARQMIECRNLRCVIEVDGGIDLDTLPDVVKAGADVLVAGTAIFHAPDPGRKTREMVELAASLSYDSKFV
jgi:ribulose-phosphate 3-epimerase